MFDYTAELLCQDLTYYDDWVFGAGQYLVFSFNLIHISCTLAAADHSGSLLFGVLERKCGSERQKGSKVDSLSGARGPDTADDSLARSNPLQAHLKYPHNTMSLIVC